MMSVMGLWSCSNDEMLPGGSDLQGHPVTLTLTVNRGDAQTRTELSENTQTGGLNDVWVSGDVLHVYDKTGEEVGTLDLIDGPNTSVGVFKGTVNATQGEQELAIWYYGDVESNPNLSFTKYSGRNGLKVDLHTQNFADVKSLSALDILSKKVTLNVNGENSTVVKDEVMEAHLAMAKFSLAGLPEGTKGTLNIYNVDGYGSNSISGEEYYNTLNTTTLDFARVGQAQTSSDKNPIVVENVVADQDVYVAFVPRSYKLGFIFTASNGDVYRYAFENSTDLEAGKYYTAGIVDGKIQGAEIDYTDKTLFGVKWAPENNHSYLDASTSNDDVYAITYIPTVSYDFQNLNFEYANDINSYLEGDLTYTYHYQWDRDFGFVATLDDYWNYMVYLPNWENLPKSFGTKSYKFANSQTTLNNGRKNLEVYYYPNSLPDWCSTSNRTEWGDRTQNNNAGAWPTNFALPTKEDLTTLLPKDKDNKFDAKFTISSEDDSWELKPFYAKQCNDGTTVVWSIYVDSEMNYLDIRKLSGKYELSKEVLEDVISNPIVYAQFSASGVRTNGGVEGYYKQGWYWAKNCVKDTPAGYAPTFYFILNDSDNPTNIEMNIGNLPRKCALSLRCKYAN